MKTPKIGCFEIVLRPLQTTKQVIYSFSHIISTSFSEKCNLNCGPHGSCESGHCVCHQGWQGERCNVKLCDQRCKDHGVCSNGTCLCTNGELDLI